MREFVNEMPWLAGTIIGLMLLATAGAVGLLVGFYRAWREHRKMQRRHAVQMAEVERRIDTGSRMRAR